jgi:hypothetical protein
VAQLHLRLPPLPLLLLLISLLQTALSPAHIALLAKRHTDDCTHPQQHVLAI